jgi:hypothetical protein
MPIIKYLVLAGSKNISSFLKDKGIYTFCASIQVLVVLASIICLAYLDDTAREQAVVRNTVRKYELNFENAVYSEQTKSYELIEQNPFIEIEQGVFTFSAEVNQTEIVVVAFSNLKDLKLGAKAAQISESDNMTCARMLSLPIYATPDSDFEKIKKGVRVGDTIELNRAQYYVVGEQVFYGIEAFHTPLIAALTDCTLQKIEIILPVGTDETTKEQLGKYLKEQFPYASISQPLTVEERAITGVSIFIFGGIIVATLAVLTFAQLFIFMVKRDKREYEVMCVCGCSQTGGKIVMLLQFAMNFTVCYIISVLLAGIALGFWGQSAVSIAYIFFGYPVFLVMLCVITWRLIAKNIRRIG